MELQIKTEDPRRRVQLLCLIAAGAVIFPFMILPTLIPGFGFYEMEEYMVLPMLVFLGATLSREMTPVAKRCFALSGVMVLWYVMAQTNHLLNDMGTSPFGNFAVVYLLAFPFAAAAEDGGRSKGLKWIGGCYVAYSVLMVLFAGLLMLDIVPEALAENVRWDGARIAIFSHPNGGACILLLSIGFTMYFITQAEKRWQRMLLVVLMLLQMFVQILTNSRTSMLLTCALIGGTIFFTIWNGKLARFLIGVVIVLAVIVVLFSVFSDIFEEHKEEQIERILLEGGDSENQHLVYDEATGTYILVGEMVAAQGELAEDMKTLNSRTLIWGAAIETLHDNPAVKRWGTEYVSAEISYRFGSEIVNAHNSWIQILLELGLPGLILAAAYTLVALWNIWILVWREVDIGKKIIAMLVICIIAASVLEVYIFTAESGNAFSNFAFFLCTGYLIQWNADAKNK